ncbi:cysteine desulfurase family protein [Pseudactinotalea sp. Z1748]|uniref:cysteine desulfurase family protein n=1 Tax=Pseudactinotalea sp. Z1748 TaxID=3413027 RepID=UPI003C7AEA51
MTTYLDHAATTPVRPEVAQTYTEACAVVGNPSSLHADGRRARRMLEEAREQVAALLGAHPTEVIFTSGGTEADNLAVTGTWLGISAAQPQRREVVTSAVEHHAVLETAQALADTHGAPLHLVPVDEQGRVRIEELADLLAGHGEQVALVSLMWANNETGTIQPVREVAGLAREHGILVHSDAVQAVGRVPVDFAVTDLDMLSLSGHKLGAPVGTGALLARREVPLTSVLHGGGQERSVRSGTVPVAGAVALARAMEMAEQEREIEHARLSALATALIGGVRDTVPGAVLRGPGPGPDRLASHVLLTIEGTDAEAVLFGLDMAGISAASGAACVAGVNQPSHVLEAMGLDEAGARSGLRLTLGHTSTPADIQAVLEALPEVVRRARAAYSPRRGDPMEVA